MNIVGIIDAEMLHVISLSVFLINLRVWFVEVWKLLHLKFHLVTENTEKTFQRETTGLTQRDPAADR